MLHASQAITARLDDLQHNLAQLRSVDTGRLNMAATSTVNAVATDILARFRGRHPGVGIHLDVSNRAAVLEQLVGNRIDLAIMGQVPDGLGLEATRFMDNPLVVIAPPDHPLVGKRKFPYATWRPNPSWCAKRVPAPVARWNASSPPAGWKSEAAWK